MAQEIEEVKRTRRRTTFHNFFDRDSVCLTAHYVTEGKARWLRLRAILPAALADNDELLEHIWQGLDAEARWCIEHPEAVGNYQVEWVEI